MKTLDLPAPQVLPLKGLIQRHLTSHISHRTSHISHLTSHISHLTSHISNLTSHICALPEGGDQRQFTNLPRGEPPMKTMDLPAPQVLSLKGWIRGISHLTSPISHLTSHICALPERGDQRHFTNLPRGEPPMKTVDLPAPRVLSLKRWIRDISHLTSHISHLTSHI